MNREEYKKWVDKANEGTIEDELNPIFVFNGIRSEILVEIINGKFNLEELAKREMENRGLDKNGKWVGFDNEID